MKLKVERINNHIVLVDESAEVKDNDYGLFDNKSIFKGKEFQLNKKDNPDSIKLWNEDLFWWVNGVNGGCFNSKNSTKIICAQKELNLDVPILPDWKEWEVEQIEKLACSIYNLNWEEYKHIREHISQTRENIEAEYEHLGLEIPNKYFDVISFIAGYNHNKAKYTKNDLIKAIELARYYPADVVGYQKDEIIQSLQKYPQFIVIESIEKRNEEFLKGCNNYKEVGCIKDVCTCYHFEPKLITNSEGKKEVIIKEIIW